MKTNKDGVKQNNVKVMEDELDEFKLVEYRSDYIVVILDSLLVIFLLL